jgi:hypothetical protein
MIKAGALSLAVLSGCAIDGRSVEVACEPPPDAGLISDFSTAKLGNCPAMTCPGPLEGSTTASLGVAGVQGLVFQYQRPESVVLALALTGDLESVSDDTSALRVVMSYDSLGRDTPKLVAGFAIELLECIDTSAYAALSFRVDGELGICPLRFALHPGHAGDGMGMACPLTQCFAATTVTVMAGITTVPLPDPAGGEDAQALAGMQWELGLPSDGSKRCSADFTIDDIRLVPAP